MNRLLANLCSLDGVRAAALFHHSGTCLEHRLDPPLQPDHLGVWLDELLVSLEAYEYIERASFRFAMAKYSGAVVAVMRTADHRAIAVATLELNPGLLTVAFGALEAKLTRLESPDGYNTATGRSIESPSGGIPERNLEDLQPQDRVPAAALEAALTAFAERVGPMARVLLREHLSGMNLPPSSIPRAAWPVLIENLAREIPDMDERRGFVEHTLPLG